MIGLIGIHKEQGYQAAVPSPKQNLKSTDFVDTMISKVLYNLHFNPNQPLKEADN